MYYFHYDYQFQIKSIPSIKFYYYEQGGASSLVEILKVVDLIESKFDAFLSLKHQLLRGIANFTLDNVQVVDVKQSFF